VVNAVARAARTANRSVAARMARSAVGSTLISGDTNAKLISNSRRIATATWIIRDIDANLIIGRGAVTFKRDRVLALLS
jgi:hypothetical protein